MIHFKCPHCESAIKVQDEAAGKKGKCRGCGETIRIPVTVIPHQVSACVTQTKLPTDSVPKNDTELPTLEADDGDDLPTLEAKADDTRQPSPSSQRAQNRKVAGGRLEASETVSVLRGDSGRVGRQSGSTFAERATKAFESVNKQRKEAQTWQIVLILCAILFSIAALTGGRKRPAPSETPAPTHTETTQERTLPGAANNPREIVHSISNSEAWTTAKEYVRRKLPSPDFDEGAFSGQNSQTCVLPSSTVKDSFQVTGYVISRGRKYQFLVKMQFNGSTWDGQVDVD